LSTRARAEC